MEAFNEFVSTLGFPDAVTVFLLIRVEKKLDELNTTLIKVIETLAKSNQ